MTSTMNGSSLPGHQQGEFSHASNAGNLTLARVVLPARRATVTYSLLGITVGLYLLQIASRSFSAGGYDYPALLGMKINQFILSGEFWRLITPVFLHASITHLLFNMYALYSFGTGLERYSGHWRFLSLYMIGGFAGNVTSFLLSDKSSLGASTAIFGLVSAEAIFIYRNRIFFGKRAGPMLANTVLIIVINLALGLSPGIDNWGHLGGLVGGLIFTWFAGPVFSIDHTSSEIVIADKRKGSRIRTVCILEIIFIGVITMIKFFTQGS